MKVKRQEIPQVLGMLDDPDVLTPLTGTNQSFGHRAIFWWRPPPMLCWISLLHNSSPVLEAATYNALVQCKSCSKPRPHPKALVGRLTVKDVYHTHPNHVCRGGLAALSWPRTLWQATPVDFIMHILHFGKGQVLGHLRACWYPSQCGYLCIFVYLCMCMRICECKYTQTKPRW